VRFEVEVMHTVTEFYAVDADSREEAWHMVSDPSGHVPADRASAVRLTRTLHGRREVWQIRRAVDDVPLPSKTLNDTLAPCQNCGSTASECASRLPSTCCGPFCKHPELHEL